MKEHIFRLILYLHINPNYNQFSRYCPHKKCDIQKHSLTLQTVLLMPPYVSIIHKEQLNYDR